ncbi:MAG: TIGR03905 family TSCPD domain-containing protein [Candidatus Gastranaerophilales bacterium]|nr:TIGR03905 family TSCPD domain-containing protein [Candidatus Gastranaerophilales bacterium]
MKEKLIYNTTGTCSKQIIIEIEDDIISNIEFIGGCQGNLQGISVLARGMKIVEVIEKLKGIRCGAKATSCPDQLASGLMKYLEEKTQIEKV